MLRTYKVQLAGFCEKNTGDKYIFGVGIYALGIVRCSLTRQGGGRTLIFR